MSTENIEALLGPQQSFEELLGPPQSFDTMLGTPAEVPPAVPDMPPGLAQSYIAEQDRLRELERQQFLADMGQQPQRPVTAPSAPVQGTPATVEDQDMLGLRLKVTRADELAAAYQKEKEILDEQLRSTTTSQAVKDAQLKESHRRMMERRVNPEGTDIGNLFESNLLMHTDGYVRGEDGRPRKATGEELLIQSMGRQTLYAGFGYEQRMAELQAQKQQRFQDALDAGKSRREAYEEADSFFQDVLTEVDTERREIRETFMGAAMRNMGLGSVLAGEFLFDTLPYFYEVDRDGGLQNPDSMSDQFAYMLDQARTSAVEGGYVSRDTADDLSRLAALGFAGPAAMAAVPFGMASVAMGGDFLDIVPVPFSPIDRDEETPVPESGLRVAASTGGFFTDVMVAHSRGRSFHDELMSIPSYREQLGDNQWLSMGPALLMEAVVPGGPVHMLQLGTKGVKAAALTGRFGVTAKQLAQSADPQKWAQAYRVGAEFADALGEDGVVDVAELVREGGDPARVVAAQAGQQLSTPYKIEGVVIEPTSTVAELRSFADTGIGRSILERAAQKLDADDLAIEHLVPTLPTTPAEALESLRPVGEKTRGAVREAILEWRMGLEAKTVGDALRSAASDAPADVVMRVLQDTVPRLANEPLPPLYADMFRLARDAAPVEQVIEAYYKAARVAGSAPINTRHVRIRQMLAMADDAVRVGVKTGLKVDSPLSVYMRQASRAEDLPDTVKFGSGIESMFRGGLQELVDVHMPRDVRFVTDRLMVPTSRATPVNMRQVGDYVRAVYQPELVEGGRYRLESVADKGVDALSVGPSRVDALIEVLEGVLPQGVTNRVRTQLQDPKGMDLKFHAFVEDAVREAGWRDILDKQGAEAVESTLEGRTTRRASERLEFREEVVAPILDTVTGALAMAERASRVTASLLPDAAASRVIVENVATYQRRWNTDLAKRWLVTTSDQMPTALNRLGQQMANEVGMVQKKYRARLQALVQAFRRDGRPSPGVRAINEYTNARWKDLTKLAGERFDRQVARLRQQVAENLDREPMRQTPSDAELASQVLYDMLGITGEFKLGKLMGYVREMDVDQQKAFVDMARAMAARAEKSQQWSHIMRAFFTKKDTRKDADVVDLLRKIDANLGEAIVSDADRRVRTALQFLRKRGEDTASFASDEQMEVIEALSTLSQGAILAPTSDNIQRVIDFLRKEDRIPQLRGRGASRRSLRSLLVGDDATLRAAQTWQMSADRQLATSRVLEDFVDQHPEFITSLSPNVTRGTEDFYDSRQLLYQAPVAVEKAVLQAVRRLEREVFGADDKQNSGYFFRALEHVSNSPRMGRAASASPDVPTQQVRAQGPPTRDGTTPTVTRFVEQGVMKGVTGWSTGQVRQFGPGARRDLAKRLFESMMRDNTLYPGRVGRGQAANAEAAARAADTLVETARGGRMPDPQSEYVVRAVRRLIDADTSNREAVKNAVVQAMEGSMHRAMVPFIENQVRNSMRRFGFSAFGTTGSLDNIVADLAEIPTDSMHLFPVPPGMGKVLDDLKLQAAKGTMLDALEDLHGRTLLADGKYAQYAIDQVAAFIRATNQMAAYGLLSAGIVIGGPLGAMPAVPLTRYIGLNVLTAPLMMVGTLGVKRATQALGMVPGQVAGAARQAAHKAFPNTVAPRAPTDILFRDLYGKEWTQQEFEELCSAYNIFMSRAEVDSTANIFKTIQRDLGIYATRVKVEDQDWWQTVAKANKGRQALAWMDPTREAVGMQFAVWTDNVFRRGAFAAAIRDGHTPMEAAKLARASVLDYGAVPDWVKQGLNKYLLFATFRAASTSEIIRSVFAGKDTWLKVLKLQMRLHQSAGTWTFGADHEKVRSFTMPGPTFDHRRTAIAGPQEVFASGAADIIDATMFGAAGLAALAGKEGAAADWWGRLVEGIQEENIQPFAQALIASFVHARPTSRGRLVNDSWVVAFKQAGLWDYAQTRFSIKEVSDLQRRDERRPGAPEHDGVQFVFTGTGYRDFQVFSYLATVLTMNRATQDYAKSIGASVYPPDGYDPKYRAIVPFYAYLPGAATPLRMKSPEDIHQRALRRDQYQ
jgi:hypothetical protein